MSDGPLIVQSDKSLLLEVDHEQAAECRKAIAPFAELERSPEHIHTYRLTPLGLWNARAAGHDAEQVVDTLLSYSRYPVPHALLVDVAETMSRYGRLRLEKHPTHGLVLASNDRPVLEEVLRAKKVAGMLGNRLDDDTVAVHPSERGNLKQALLKIGWPAEDYAGYVDGEAHPIELAEDGWTLRTYQAEAAESFWHGGSGVVVLPCGAGKTIVGAAAMAEARATTLILVTNTVSARQWKDELLRRTSLTEDEIGEYSGTVKEIRPVTIATYQVVTTKRKGVYPHLELFDARDWGLIVYDEVHLLPAPIFRMTADLQARRRLGLTATLVREDGREGDVFSLIGPKRYDAPWKDIEAQGWIAPADCIEVRVSLPDASRMAYATSEPEERYRLAACTPEKVKVVRDLVTRHAGQPTLVIGQYLEQLDELAEALDAPMITGQTPVKERQRLFNGFRSGEIGLLVVSKVANFSIDLPSAEVAIQVSGSFGSRQEEAQRLGRLLRPGEPGPDGERKIAHFYTIVSRDTVDAEFAQNRQRFLAEQGYAYRIVDADDLGAPSADQA
ncbi:MULTISPECIES: DNA repair helicase XPB [unclassified Nocardioides]|uniref:DNA repair helicase XPB n=1 Tax=unclassified Nocardioides TaxID=2615069 RepID=UPI0007029D6C|nr:MULTISPECIES: DNA repair helicase XPB [unclassified Nocardioides]KRC59594.1 helicase [Nocardioides sp. Root79]KRC68581.1 helicase [Nocardioides sp. Root240]